MTLTITIPKAETDKILPPEKDLADAAAYGMEVKIRRHLRDKNNSTEPNPHGLPKSNYYAQVADTVKSSVRGSRAEVTIGPDDESVPGNGIALHYHGGTVYPKKKALAIPVNAAVAGIWPSEAGKEDTDMVWPKGSHTGRIVDKESGRTLWLLVPKATIPADPTVLPTDGEILAAAESSIVPVLEAS